MYNVKIINEIQAEKMSEIEKTDTNPDLDSEGKAIMDARRFSIDEPPTVVKTDPLR